MGTNNKGPRIVDVLAEIARELRIANQMRALTLPASVLEHNTTSKASTPAAKERVARKNDVRRDIRVHVAFEAEEEQR